MKELNKYFDHTLLKPEATEAQINKLCEEAKEYDFYSVCVNSCYVKSASEKLKGTDVKIAAVVGFPLGAMSTKAKAFEASEATADGADEIDMVINVGMLKDKRYDEVRADIKAVADASHSVKVILETCLLTDDEIITACRLSEEAGADFVKTSTGFSTGGATEHHVSLMKETVGDRLKVKASGGIRTLDTTLRMIEAGADRIGASASVNILKEEK